MGSDGEGRHMHILGLGQASQPVRAGGEDSFRQERNDRRAIDTNLQPGGVEARHLQAGWRVEADASVGDGGGGRVLRMS